MLIIGGAVFLTIISFLLILIFMSSGKPNQFLDKKGEVLENSMSEKVFLEINGTRQGMFIKGENLDNPIILYLHGGIPVYFLIEKFSTQLEKNFGVYVIDKAPELYYAYIGIAQMSDQRKSEKIAYNYMLGKYQELGNRKMVKVLQQISLGYDGDIPDEYVKIRDIAMHELGIGTMRTMKNLITDLILPSLLFSEYTLSEKYNLWVKKSQSGISQNWKVMINTNLMESKNSFLVPVYFFHGIDDYTCSYELAKEYFAKIKAPTKGFYTFYQSAHSPILEEPIKMNKILVNDIVNSRTELADKME